MIAMTIREEAKTIIDNISDEKMNYVVLLLKSAALVSETPNIDTLEAFCEVDNGNGTRFTGSTEDFMASLLA